MNTPSLLIAGLVKVFSICSNAYQIGQTTNDVYYSPAPPQDEYVTNNTKRKREG